MSRYLLFLVLALAAFSGCSDGSPLVPPESSGDTLSGPEPEPGQPSYINEAGEWLLVSARDTTGAQATLPLLGDSIGCNGQVVERVYRSVRLGLWDDHADPQAWEVAYRRVDQETRYGTCTGTIVRFGEGRATNAGVQFDWPGPPAARSAAWGGSRDTIRARLTLSGATYDATFARTDDLPQERAPEAP